MYAYIKILLVECFTKEHMLQSYICSITSRLLFAMSHQPIYLLVMQRRANVKELTVVTNCAFSCCSINFRPSLSENSKEQMWIRKQHSNKIAMKIFSFSSLQFLTHWVALHKLLFPNLLYLKTAVIIPTWFQGGKVSSQSKPKKSTFVASLTG